MPSTVMPAARSRSAGRQPAVFHGHGEPSANYGWPRSARFLDPRGQKEIRRVSWASSPRSPSCARGLLQSSPQSLIVCPPSRNGPLRRGGSSLGKIRRRQAPDLPSDSPSYASMRPALSRRRIAGEGGADITWCHGSFEGGECLPTIGGGGGWACAWLVYALGGAMSQTEASIDRPVRWSRGVS